MEIDKIIHEPARLRVMMILAGLEQADFTFLVTTLGLTRGNLNRHFEHSYQPILTYTPPAYQYNPPAQMFCFVHLKIMVSNLFRI